MTLGASGAGDPLQTGLGTSVSSMPSDFTQGNVDPSGIATDVAIMNNGFFAVQKDGVTSYTLAGNFHVGAAKITNTTTPEFFSGNMADLLVARSALTPAQIQQLINQGLTFGTFTGGSGSLSPNSGRRQA